MRGVRLYHDAKTINFASIWLY